MGLAQALPNPRTQPVPEAMVRAWLLMLLAQRSVGLESNASDADAECLLQSRAIFEEDGGLSGLALSNSIMDLAESLQPGATQDLLRSFRICGRCKRWQRFGEKRDGGYVSCMDHMAHPDIRAAYSMGIEKHDLWSVHVHENFQVPIYQYDCTVSKPAAVCDHCKFFQACLKGEDGRGGFQGKTAWTLKQAIRKSGKEHLPDRSLLMKIDIEGAEWPTLGTASTATLRKFRQLLIEFHDLGDEGRHSEFLSTMQNLQKAGFKVVHLHGNDFSRNYKKGPYSIPSVIEVSMDSTVEDMSTCLAQEQRLPLDAKNRKKIPHGKKDLPKAHLPKL